MATGTWDRADVSRVVHILRTYVETTTAAADRAIVGLRAAGVPKISDGQRIATTFVAEIQHAKRGLLSLQREMSGFRTATSPDVAALLSGLASVALAPSSELSKPDMAALDAVAFDKAGHLKVTACAGLLN
jgi:hypothetical protein